MFRMPEGGEQNALFKIATKQYLGHLMSLEGEGKAECFIEDSPKAIFRTLEGVGVVQNALFKMFRTLDNA